MYGCSKESSCEYGINGPNNTCQHATKHLKDIYCDEEHEEPCPSCKSIKPIIEANEILNG